MTDFINAIKDLWSWFVDTGLPKESANAIVDMVQTYIIPLMRDYITVLFG